MSVAGWSGYASVTDDHSAMCFAAQVCLFSCDSVVTTTPLSVQVQRSSAHWSRPTTAVCLVTYERGIKELVVVLVNCNLKEVFMCIYAAQEHMEQGTSGVGCVGSLCLVVLCVCVWCGVV